MRLVLYALVVAAWPIAWIADLATGRHPRARLRDGLDWVRSLH